MSNTMAPDEGRAKEWDPEKVAELNEAMRASQPGRRALEQEVDPLIRGLMQKSLACLEVALPHEVGDGSENEQRFRCLRKQVLDTANDNRRQVPLILNNYIVNQVYQREVVTKVVAAAGPNGLPLGVEHPR